MPGSASRPLGTCQPPARGCATVSGSAVGRSASAHASAPAPKEHAKLLTTSLSSVVHWCSCPRVVTVPVQPRPGAHVRPPSCPLTRVRRPPRPPRPPPLPQLRDVIKVCGPNLAPCKGGGQVQGTLGPRSKAGKGNGLGPQAYRSSLARRLSDPLKPCRPRRHPPISTSPRSPAPSTCNTYLRPAAPESSAVNIETIRHAYGRKWDSQRYVPKGNKGHVPKGAVGVGLVRNHDRAPIPTAAATAALLHHHITAWLRCCTDSTSPCALPCGVLWHLQW